MTKFYVEIDTSNAAFEEALGHPEVARLLRVIARRIEEGWSNFEVSDANGNVCGKVEW